MWLLSTVDRLLIDWWCAPITGDLEVFKTHQLAEREGGEKRERGKKYDRDVVMEASGLVLITACWVCARMAHVCCLTPCVCRGFIVGIVAFSIKPCQEPHFAGTNIINSELCVQGSACFDC